MDNHPEERRLAVALNLVPGFGPRAFKAVTENLGSLHEVFSAGESSLAEWGIPRQVAGRLVEKDWLALAAEEEDRALRLGARLITFLDDDYPVMLRYLYDPPAVLYHRGPLDLRRSAAVAVVGSRRPSPYGTVTAEQIGRDLAGAGFNVVSGLARGVDTAAHRGALSAGHTTAVFGTGLDVVYPSENKALAEKVAASGACLSEFPLGAMPDRFTFPRRNRIISGLALAVVVVEAGERSGALITAEFAAEQGREVFAVPGPVGSGKSSGCHQLLKEGARLYERLDDLLEELAPYLAGGARGPAARSRPPAAGKVSEEEMGILSLLQGESLFLDEIVSRSGLPAQKVTSLMLALELKGLVRQFPGKRYIRTPGEP